MRLWTGARTEKDEGHGLLRLTLLGGGRIVQSASAIEISSARRLVALVCLAQVLVQIGAFFWPALLPQLAPHWGLSNSGAGWITAAFYGAYMLAVPILVPLTDRYDPKRIYLLGVA